MLQDNIVSELKEIEWKNAEKAEAVIDLWMLGYNLIPAHNKKALVEWKKWQSKRIDHDTLCGWFRNPWQVSPINFYLLTGACSYSHAIGLVVIDGDDETACLEIERRCPSTAIMTRTSRGRHYFYRHPGYQVSNRGGTTIDGLKLKIDIKADGGYVGCPGGPKYQWSTPWTRELIETLPVYDPSWLPNEFPRIEKLALPGIVNSGLTMDERTRQAKHYVSRHKGAEAGKGAGRYALALAITLLHGFLLTEEEAVEVLLEWGQKEDQRDDLGNYYPWSEAEIYHKVADAAMVEYRGVRGDKLDPFFDLENKLQTIIGGFHE
jgi:hypothetical protein